MATINQNRERTKLTKISIFTSFSSLLAVRLIKFYQQILSPALHSLSLGTVVGGCRFYPSCSEYSMHAIKQYGFNLKSIRLILSRLFRCRPYFLFNNKHNKNTNKYSGYDPVK